MKNALKLERQVAAILKAERLKQNVSQQALADKALMSKSMILFIETGRRHPTLLTLHRIATALNVKISEIIAQAEEEATKAS